ncbi:MAG: O-antigen ligase family protein [Clostridia bacterium]|nr:O-antigen ligase family protein [Clostridia bacterium]
MEIKRKKRSALDKFSGWCFGVLKKSLIGKFFTSYENANLKFQKITTKKSKNRHVSHKNSLARMLENNVFAKVIPAIYHFFLRISVANYAAITVTMGMISLAMYLLNYFGLLSLGDFNATEVMFILPATLIIVGFPFLFSRKSLASAILTNKLFSFIVVGFLGCDTENIKNVAHKNRISSTGIFFILGAALGALAYFIQRPEYILFTISIIVFAYVIFRTPETGIILMIFTLPFVHILITQISIIYVLICYFVKVILHKRVISFEYYDVWPALTIFIMVIFGIDYQNPLNSLPRIVANVTILISYFLIANLIRSKEWFKKCIFALTSSAFITALFGIGQAILGTLSIYFPSFGDYSMYETTVNSIFSTYNAFSQYMVIAIPFALVHIFADRREMSKIGGFLVAIILTTGLFVARSKSAFIGILIGVLLLLIIYNRNYIYIALLTIATPIILYFSLRNNEYVMRFIRSFDFFKEFNPMEKLYDLRDGFLVWLENPLGTGAGSASVEFDSFLIQMLVEYGIVVVVAFAICALMFARLVLSYCAKAKGRHKKVNCSAGFCALCGIFATGLFANVWGDSKIMLLSITCMALSFAYIKIEREAHVLLENKSDLSRASIDIELAEEDDHEYISARKSILAMPKKKKKKTSQELEKTATVKIKDGFDDDDVADDEDRV